MRLNIKKNIVLAPYTTFKIGGPAKYFCEAKTKEEILELCSWVKERKVPIFILGGGSNVLISDNGFDGLVIKIQSAKFEIRNSEIFAEAGIPLAKLVTEAAKHDLSGLEWAIGIPGAVGGAICGNAGAFGKSISEIIKEVEVFDLVDCETKIFKKEDCKFGYRNSFFKRNSNLVILSAMFNLKKGNRDKIQKTIKNYTRQRLESNPIGYSAGCFFKNIEWKEAGEKKKIIAKFPELAQFGDRSKISTGFLIESVGLKGKKIGGAAVSDKHANFILNDGSARAKDVVDLANLIKEKIRRGYGLNLEEEVAMV